MAKRRVLIVDDSKTAQVRLRKMLEKFDTEVDTVFSAEEALGYLSYRQPVVIFLDHHMDGMDGLAALKIIKSNPSTALIPVIMYTSEQSDAYVAQARAHGAMDIISKDVIEYSSLEKVLGSLNIGPKSTAPKDKHIHVEAPKDKPANLAPKRAARTRVAASAVPSLEAQASRVPVVDDDTVYDISAYSLDDTGSSELEKVRLQVSRLFEIHIAKVRQEIEDSTKFLTRRMSREMQDKFKNEPSSANDPESSPDTDDEVLLPEESFKSESPEKSGTPVILFLALVLSVGFIGYQLFLSVNQQNHLQNKLDMLIKQTQHQDSVMREKIDGLASKEPTIPEPRSVDGRVLLDALGWAVNVNTQTRFNAMALSDERIYILGELLSLLKAANFVGGIYIDIHAGNYCVIEGPSGQWLLPEPESNIEDCSFLADKVRDVAVDDQVSVGFLNYLHSNPIITKGAIDVNLSSQGYSSPKYSYPPLTSATSAGEWNAAAQRNNRIEFSFAED